MSTNHTLISILAQITVWIIAPCLLCFGLSIIYRNWKHDREQKRKWAEEGVRQHSVRQKTIYLEKL